MKEKLVKTVVLVIPVVMSFGLGFTIIRNTKVSEENKRLKVEKEFSESMLEVSKIAISMQKTNYENEIARLTEENDQLKLNQINKKK